MLHQWLKFDHEKEIDWICTVLRQTLKRFRRRGYVIGVSGGIDSSVSLALCIRAIGKERVLSLQMPERHSAKETDTLSNLLIEKSNVNSITEPITGILEAVGFYERYNKSVCDVIPKYGPGWSSKITISNIFEKKGFTFFTLVVQSPTGEIFKKRLPAKIYLEIIAATNFKQRIRKMLEYYHADRINYAVVGTPNRLEYDQGFFVKNGDGSADIKPIAHLYKSQVYALAGHLEIPKEICTRPPTTDTYSMLQGQDEFYFSLPYEQMDICLFGKNNGYTPDAVAEATGLTIEQIIIIFKDIDTKRSTTQYLHTRPVLTGDISEIK